MDERKRPNSIIANRFVFQYDARVRQFPNRECQRLGFVVQERKDKALRHQLAAGSAGVRKPLMRSRFGSLHDARTQRFPTIQIVRFAPTVPGPTTGRRPRLFFPALIHLGCLDNVHTEKRLAMRRRSACRAQAWRMSRIGSLLSVYVRAGHPLQAAAGCALHVLTALTAPHHHRYSPRFSALSPHRSPDGQRLTASKQCHSVLVNPLPSPLLSLRVVRK